MRLRLSLFLLFLGVTALGQEMTSPYVVSSAASQSTNLSISAQTASGTTMTIDRISAVVGVPFLGIIQTSPQTANSTYTQYSQRDFGFPWGVFYSFDTFSESFFEVSKGYYSDKIKLSWQLLSNQDKIASINIYRTEDIDSDNPSWGNPIQNLSKTTAVFEDENVEGGKLYRYKVQVVSTETNGNVDLAGVNNLYTGFIEGIGYRNPSGLITGNVSYEGGNPVSGVTIAAVPDGGSSQIGTSLSIPENAKIQVDAFHENLQDAFTVQQWVKPYYNFQPSDTIQLFEMESDAGEKMKALLSYSLDDGIRLEVASNTFIINGFIPSGKVDNSNNDLMLPVSSINSKFTHFSFVFENDTTPQLYINGRKIDTAYVEEQNERLESGEMTMSTVTSTLSINYDSNGVEHSWTKISLGGKKKAIFDEFRLYSKALTSDIIFTDFRRYLRGNENGLHVYLRFNEGRGKYVYDLAYKSFTYFGNNGRFVEQSNTIQWEATADRLPESDQLGILGVTDDNGNYVISAIPYQGTGETYLITPSLGRHQFSPTQELVFIGAGSTVINNVDFIDKSSFTFRGRILYDSRGVFPQGDDNDDVTGDIRDNEAYNAYVVGDLKYPKGEYWAEYGTGTESQTIVRLNRYAPIPLSGAYVYIDNQLVIGNDNVPVESDDEGRFAIDVPIGMHAIRVEKNGHDFIYEGRFPKKDTIVTLDQTRIIDTNFDFFEDTDEEVVFIDQTRVDYIGRVVGGTIEAEKPLGFGFDGTQSYQASTTAPEVIYSSKNNIGTASITLGYRQPGVTSITDEFKSVFSTNSETGEFRISLLPLRYELDQNDLYIPTQTTEVRRFLEANQVLNFSNVNIPQENHFIYEGDTIATSLPYNYTSKFIYRSTPEINVLEQTYDTELTVGEASYTVTNTNFALYTQGGSYRIRVQKIERYTNHELPDDEQLSVVPVTDGDLVVTNNLVDSRPGSAYFEENEDDPSILIYHFVAGAPNTDVSSNFQSTLSLLYRLNTVDYSITGYLSDGVILGSKSSGGQTFETAGPEIPDIILRDPPGSESFATIEQGSSFSSSREYAGAVGSSIGASVAVKGGLKVGVGGGILGPLIESESYVQLTTGINFGFTSNFGNELTTNYSFSQSISTSDDPDWVGADADLYIGTSYNQFYGVMDNIEPTLSQVTDTSSAVVSVPINTTSGTLYISKNKALFFSPGDERTVFIYSQRQILTDILPFYSDIVENYDCIVNDTDPCPLSIDGDLKPQVWYESQIKLWRRVIQINEETKHMANSDREGLRQRIEGDFQRYFSPGDSEQSNTNGTFFNPPGETLNQMFQENFFENISFDSGVGEFTKTVGTGKTDVNEYTVGFELEQSNELEVVLDYGGNGGTIKVENKNTAAFEYTNNDERESTLDISYTLKDGDDYNKLSVDVVNAFDGNGPVFVTKGGETSCPVEEATYSNFFHPNLQPVSEDSASTVRSLEENEKIEISKGTVAIEVPHIEVENASVSNVPETTAAEFSIRLRNDSVLEPEESEFILYVDQTTNPNNAIINLDDTGTPFYLDGGETVEYTLTLEKGSQNISEYNDIRIVFESMCDDDLSEEILISAAFVESCSKVEIIDPQDNWVMNQSNAYTSSGETVPLLIELQSFDYTDENFERIDLEYRLEGSPTWTNLKVFVASQTIIDQLISDGETNVVSITSTEFSYSWDIAGEGLPDGNYEIRARSTCNNDTEYYSTVIRGKVDITPPMLFGTPSPTDGILSLGDDLSARFSEPIKSNGTLTRYEFLVQKNQLPVNHEVSLAFSGDDNVGEIENPFIQSGDFGVEFWLKNNVSNGTAKLISQEAGVNVQLTNNQMTFVLGSETVTTNILSDGSYHHYALSYEAATGSMKIIENDVIRLQQVVTQNLNFNSNFSIFVGGENFNGNLHDLRLWRKAVSREDAVANMNELLSGDEQDLIGYWPMNEGNGALANDIARSKHMLLSNIDWDIFPSSTAYSFDGTNYLRLDQANRAVTTANQDISLTFWFKTNQSGPATLISNGKGDNTDSAASNGYRNKWAINLDGQGILNLKAENQDYSFGDVDVTDNLWHQAAIVLKRNGNLLMFLDGERVDAHSNENLGGFSGSTLFIGARGQIQQNGSAVVDQHFNGQIDEFRLWNMARTAEQIDEDRFYEANYESIGLLLYAPMNEPAQANTNGPKYWYPYNSFEMRSAYAELSGSPLNYTLVSPPIKPRRPTERLVVNGTINYDELLLTPQISDWAGIENKIAYITVANLYDLSDNRQLSPVSWTAFINKNPLKWFIEGQGSAVEYVKEEAAELSFEIKIRNRSGLGQPYSILTPDWMTIDESTGSVPPNGTITLVAKIRPEISSGVYDDQIVLTSDYNFNEKIFVKLRVTAKEPDWGLSPTAFEESMSLIGKVKIDNSFSTDPYDRLVAYRDGEVRGVVGLTYDEDYDDYFALLTVYSNPEDESNVSFKIWDASAGRIKDATVNLANTLPFVNNAVQGNFQTPLVFETNGAETQEITFNTGWTWVTFNVANSNFGDLNTLFESLELTTSDLIQSFGPSRFDQYEVDPNDENNTGWFGTISSNNGIDYNKMYKVKLETGQKFLVSGGTIDLSQWTFSLQQNWNWLPYMVTRNVPVGEALANYNPQNGDVIKSQTEFAIYDGANGWKGSMTYMYAGQGYMLKASSAQNFSYPSYLNLSDKRADEQVPLPTAIAPEFAKMKNTMNLVGKIPEQYDGITIYNSQNELVGEATALDGREASYKDIFATIYGEQSDKLSIFFTRGTTQKRAKTSLIFVPDGLYGSIQSPIYIEDDRLIKSSFNAYPNPFIDRIQLEFRSGSTGEALIQVFDINQREVTAAMLMVKEGVNSLDLPLPAVPSGTYVLQLHLNGSIYSKILLKE